MNYNDELILEQIYTEKVNIDIVKIKLWIQNNILFYEFDGDEIDGYTWIDYNVKDNGKYVPFTIDSKGFIDVDREGIKLTRITQNLEGEKLPPYIKFGYVENDFNCSHTSLESLIGCPVEVGGKFNCTGCSIKNLVGAPDVCDNLCCDSCMYLESLEGAPSKCHNFFVNNCPSLENLKFSPRYCDYYSCKKNEKLNRLTPFPTDKYGKRSNILQFDEDHSRKDPPHNKEFDEEGSSLF